MIIRNKFILPVLFASLQLLAFSSEIQALSESTIIIQEDEIGVVEYDGSIYNNNPGFTGIGFINTENSVGKGITWELCAPDTGEYILEWRYAQGLSGNRIAKVLVNGNEAVAQVDFEPTGDWAVWDTTSAVTVTLLNGPNLIRLESTNKDGLANIDYMAVTGADPSAGFCAVAVNGVRISPDEAKVGVKGKKQLSADIIPANATNQHVYWSSSDTSVATINESGMLSGAQEGSAQIVVTTEDGSFTDTCSVSIIRVPVYYLETSVNGQGTVLPSSDSIAEGSVVCLSATPAEGWRFTGWSGDTSGMESPVCFTMDSPKSVRANFTEITAHIIGFSDQTTDGYAGYKGTIGGGTTTPVIVTSPTEFRAAVSNSNPAVVIVKGRLNVGTVSIGSNKTIAGYDEYAGLYGGTIKMQGTNYIIQNLHIGPGSGDVMELSGASNVFITKCSMHDAGDEILSIVRASDYVTVSWCKFYFDNTHSHAFAHLIGNSDDRPTDRGKLHVTMHHNWYAQGIRGRMPRVRYGHVHIYNNYYNSAGSGYCIGVGYECHIRIEETSFEGVSNPWKDFGGVENGEIGWNGLKFVSCSQPTFVTNSFPVYKLPYSYIADPVDSVKNLVLAGAGNVIGVGGTSDSILISVTAPSEDEEFENNATIELVAEASVLEGSIDSVQFYQGHNLIGVSRSVPYTYQWENAPGGKHKITAKAFGNEGKSTFSDIINIAVKGVTGNTYHESQSIVLYPNPVIDQLSIQLNDECFDNAYISLYDSRGMSILTERVRNRIHVMDLGAIPAGIYLISFTTDQGNIVKKLVKE